MKGSWKYKIPTSGLCHQTDQCFHIFDGLFTDKIASDQVCEWSGMALLQQMIPYIMENLEELKANNCISPKCSKHLYILIKI